MKQKIIAITVALIILTFKIYGQISVTDVNIEPLKGAGAIKSLASVVIDNVLKINEIQVIKIGDKTTLKFPVYVSRSGREYPQVKVHTKEANDKILKAIETKKPSSEKPKSVKFKIGEIFHLRNPKTRLANVDITFNNEITVVVGVMRSKREGQEYWIAYPSRKDETTGKWLKQVIIINREFKYKVEDEIIKAFKASASQELEE